MQPIPGGYPIEDRIPNSAQVRLTSDGKAFIEENISDIVAVVLPEGLDFPVGPIDAAGQTICPADTEGNTDCVAHLEIPTEDEIGVEPFTLTPVAPNTLRAHARVIVDSRNQAGVRSTWPGNCTLDIDTRNEDRDYIGFTMDVNFVEETQPARAGYTKVEIEDAKLADGEGIQFGGFLGIGGSGDVDLGGGFLCDIADALKSVLGGVLEDQVTNLLNGALEEQLCTKPGELGCPNGTYAVGDENPVCRYEDNADAACVSQLLGTDGQGDLGSAFLGGFSPGVHAPGQFLLASGGDGEAVNDGLSLFAYGGFRGTDPSFTESPAHNPCVPVVEPPPLPEIPRVETFRANGIPGSDEEVHLGIGLSEAYLGYAGYGLFDSGMLCLGVGTRLSQQISTSLFSLLINSLEAVAFPSDNAPLSLALRPQKPPVFEVGTGAEGDEHLRVTLPDLEMDFYVWSSERYVRFMTFRSTLTLPINLKPEGGALVLDIGDIGAEGSSVKNSELLEEPTDELAVLIQDILQMFAGMIVGGIDPIMLPDIMGFELDVPENGITGIEDSGHEFLGIYAKLGLAPTPMAYTATADTDAFVEGVHFDPRVVQLETYGDGEIPWVRIAAQGFGPAGSDYEYSVRLDGMTWSDWQEGPYLTIQDRVLRLQARHEIEVRARIAGSPGTEDVTPAKVEVLIDAIAPEVELARLDTQVRIDAHDVISPDEQLEWRWRANGNAWSDWATLGEDASIPAHFDDSEIDVEVRDESGNVGSATAPLIRGIPNPDRADGCGCSAPGERTTSPLVSLGLLGLFGLWMGRRSRRGRRRRPARRRLAGQHAEGHHRFGALVLFVALTTGLGGQGCDCSGDEEPDPGPCGGMCGLEATAPSGEICCEPMDMCVIYDRDSFCDPGYECLPENVALDDACAVSCAECTAKPALDPGLLATYLDFVVAEDGTIVISGYSPGDPARGRKYGDLVIGTYDTGATTTTWEIVDGAPASPITNDPDGWRGGVSAPGVDVGRWTSIVESGGTYYVAYQDVAEADLKMAVGSPGSWAIHTIDEEGDAGRYTSLLLDGDGNPVVAYLRIAKDPEDPTVVQSSIQMAVAGSAEPGAAEDWTISQVAGSAMPCRPAFCGAGETCLEGPGLCVEETDDCADGCGSDQACYMGACENAVDDGFVEDLIPAYGLYVSLATTPAGLAAVWYDRSAGNLYGASYDGVGWSEPFVIDGYAVGAPDIGDAGQSASLFVDAAGVWHVSYVDGTEEAVRYARVEGETITTELVDDGSTDGAMRHPDGRHIVGDDSSIVVTEDGTVRIAYQDATAHRVMIATKADAETAWAVQILDEADHTGWWVEQLLSGGTSYVATHWRGSAGEAASGVRILSVE